jgi:glycosyltransferase involved in cell wall biosynthesis
VKVAFFCILPSPYQRDLLQAINSLDGVTADVFYLEESTPDSPWPVPELRSFEHVLPGICITLRGRRIHLNHRLPGLDDYDVVVMNCVMEGTAQFIMRTHLKNKPWVFWAERFRTDPLASGGWLHRWALAPIKKAAAIAGIGQRAVDDYSLMFPNLPVFNIPYHTDLSQFKNQVPKVRDSAVVNFLFCGQMIARKGIDTLLDSFRRVHAQLPDATLTLVGREADLPSHLAGLPLQVQERIHYLGFRAPDQLGDVFREADVFVLQSLYDGWGVVVNQALGAGLPIIVSDQVGAGVDLVAEEKNGIRFTAGDVNGLTAAMLKLGANREIRKRFAENSASMAENWTPAQGAQRWLRLFEAIRTP